MNQRNLPHVVIIGAGFGGLSAARALRRAPVRVTVIDRRNHHLFQPLLYQVATAGLSPADIAVPIRAVLSRQMNTDVLMAEVLGIDPKRKAVRVGPVPGMHEHEHELPYDFLVIATGATHGYFGHDDWANFAPGLKSIPDATEIRRKVLLAFEAAEVEADLEQKKSLLRFILIGGGPTGVEMAGAIAELTRFTMASDFRYINPKEVEILLIEAGPRILATYDESLSRKATRALERLGVKVMTGARVQDVNGEGVVVGGKRIASRTIVWAAGVVASPAGIWLGSEVDHVGRVWVGPDLTVPGLKYVYVIGDTAHAEQDGKLLPGIAPVAMQQGRYVARGIEQRVDGRSQEEIAKESPFRYRDKGSLATVGRSFAVGHLGRLKFSGFPGWIIWIAVHIYYLIGFRNRVLVLLEWAWAYLTFQRGARLITNEDRVGHDTCSS